MKYVLSSYLNKYTFLTSWKARFELKILKLLSPLLTTQQNREFPSAASLSSSHISSEG